VLTQDVADLIVALGAGSTAVARVERATARAYRLGIPPPDLAWATLRRVDQPLVARPRLPPSAG
jgi:hypothetical protein